MKDLLLKYKEVILYLIFGVCTTLVNIVSYAVLTRSFGVGVMASTACAWALSVAFAYVTNRIWVFESKVRSFTGVCREIASFVGCRVASGAMDIFLMWLLVEMMGFSDMIIKILSNILVIVFNYVASKFWIFKKKGQ